MAKKVVKRTSRETSTPGSVTVSMGLKPSVNFCSIDFNVSFTQELEEGESMEKGFERVKNKAEKIMAGYVAKGAKFLWDQIEESKKHAK